MKQFKKLIVILTVVLSFCMIMPQAFAATVDNGDVSVSLTTDKEAYKADEPIKATLELKNNTDDVLTKVSLENVIPEGYELSENYVSIKQIDVLDANETVTLSDVYVVPSAGLINSSALLYIALAVIIVAGAAVSAIVLIRRKKVKSNAIVSMVLAVTMLSLAMPLTANAAQDNQIATVTKQVKVDESPVALEANVTYNGERFTASQEFIDADDDGVADYLEEYFNTDKSKGDSDSDGLSDYIELFKTKTDPLKKDSDGNGIDDAEEDTDRDGLINRDEVKYKTSLVQKDSDSDGLTDNEEINEYMTDPLKKDTDGDGITDGDEIVLNLNPLKQSTDGKIKDSEVLTKQTLSDDCIDNLLLSEKICVKPCVFGMVNDIIDKHVSISAANVYALEDNKAVVGDPIEIKSDYNNKCSLKLSFDCSSCEYEANKLMICEYKGSKIIPCDTAVDDNSIVTDVTSGIYFVINPQIQLENLGINIEDGLKGAALNKYKKSKCESVGASSTNGAADIVFVVDSTGSMDKHIKNVSENIEDFISNIIGTNSNVSINLALVDFKDLNFDESITVHKNGNSEWFSSISQFRKKLDSLEITGGVDAPETALDAVSVAQTLNFRNNANKFIILITDSNYKISNTGVRSIDILANNLAQSGIVTSVITKDKYSNRYKALSEETGGKMENIENDFSETMDDISDDIGEVTVSEDHWVILSDYQCVKLDSEVSSTTDTDGDGLNDAYELGTRSVVNLNSYIRSILINNGLPEKEYSGKNSIYVYNYRSNPVLPDTDFDGKGDRTDLAPLSYYFEGDLHTNYADSHVNFTVNYRWFFDDSMVYNSSLSKLSLLYSSAVYHENTLKITDSKGNVVTYGTTIPAIMNYFGMGSAKTYFLGDNANDIGYTKNTDEHMSEVAVGHHTVEYKGQTKTIVAVTVRGTNGTIEEWQSNFDLGDSNTYLSTTDWKRSYNHKGFDIAANRIMSIVEKYCQKYNINDSDACYWITGHSRGAAIANLIGGYYADQNKKAFTYTFAAPSTTTATNVNASKYNSIFNIINTDDFVPCLPLERWKFKRYGKCSNVSLADNYEAEWEDMTGIFDYNPDSNGMDDTVNALAEIIIDSNHPESSVNAFRDCYKYTCKCHGDNTSDNITIKNRGTSESSREGAIDKIPPNALPYCIIKRYKGTAFWGWDFDCCQTPAYFMQVLAAEMAGTISTYRFVVELDIADRYEHAKTQIIYSAISGISHPHYTESYYVLANNIIM